MSIVRAVRDQATVALRPLAVRAWVAFWEGGVRGMLHGEYTLHVPSGRRAFTPWFDPKPNDNFWVAYGEAEGSGEYVASPESSYLLYQFCESSLLLDGAIAECGTYKGGTAHLLAALLERSGRARDFHLFDTFTGMPASAKPERDYHGPGAFPASLPEVQGRLDRFPFVRFHAGTIPETLQEVADVDDYAFVYVNVDIYESTLDCCRWFWPRLQKGGIMFIGRYGFFRYRYAARAAADLYFADKPEKPIVLPTGDAVVIKR